MSDTSKSKSLSAAVRQFLMSLCIVVLLVLAFVVWIVVLNVRGLKCVGMIDDTKASMRSVATALESYFVDHQAYPEHVLTGRGRIWRRGGASKPLTALPLEPWFLEYISKEKCLDPWIQGEAFGYYNYENRGWVLFAAGPDRDYDMVPHLDYPPVRDEKPGGLDRFKALRSYDPTNATRSPGDIWRIHQH